MLHSKQRRETNEDTPTWLETHIRLSHRVPHPPLILIQLFIEDSVMRRCMSQAFGMAWMMHWIISAIGFVDSNVCGSFLFFCFLDDEMRREWEKWDTDTLLTTTIMKWTRDCSLIVFCYFFEERRWRWKQHMKKVNKFFYISWNAVYAHY